MGLVRRGHQPDKLPFYEHQEQIAEDATQESRRREGQVEHTEAVCLGNETALRLLGGIQYSFLRRKEYRGSSL